MRSLSARLLVMLTIALLPLGLIAVYQTLKVIEEAQRIAESDFLARTVQAADAEISLIRRAHGVAYGLGTAAAATEADEAMCEEIMKRFVAQDGQFIFAGFMRQDGQMNCSSTDANLDFSEGDEWKDFLQNPRRKITFNPQGTVSGRSVFVATTPIYGENDLLIGAGVVSTPHNIANELLATDIENLEISIIDAEGNVISSSADDGDDQIIRSLGLMPAQMKVPESGVTVQTGNDDKDVAIAIVPLIGGENYVVGVWSDTAEPFGVSLLGSATPLFPVLMWLMSLFVAFYAIDRLVLQYLKKLRSRMAVFSADDFSGSYVRLRDAPSEINEIANSYNQMIDRIAHDHDALAQNIREKDILLKEIHHRVKNNLQLIASILNMQLRQIGSSEAKSVLRRVQDRVMSLATIHKSLYTDTNVDTVRIDRLLGEIIRSSLNVANSPGLQINSKIDLDPIELDPDQAVPLSLLVTEAITNAVKYAGNAEQGKPSLSVKLSEPSPAEVHLVVENSRGKQNGDVAEGTGMGARLIEAFVQQLGGEIDVTETDDRYVIRVQFTKLHHAKNRPEAA